MILLLLFVYHISAQSTLPPVWLPNPYLQTKVYQVKSNFSTTTQKASANITFTVLYTSPPQVAFGITTYSGNDGLYQENFYMQTIGLTATQVQINMVIVGITNIRLFYVMYVAIDPNFMYHLNAFNDIQANYTPTGTKSLSPIDTITTSPRTFTNVINYTQLCVNANSNFKKFGINLSKDKVAVYLSGVYNQANSASTPVSFSISTNVLNTTHFQLTVTVNPSYRIWLLRLSFIGMDIENVEASGQFTIVYSTGRYYFDKDYYIPLEQAFFNNIFIGMLDFNTKGPGCTIDFQLVFDQPNSRIIVKKSVPNSGSLFPSCGLVSAEMNIFYVKTWYCPPPNYYFNLQTNLCDNYCPKYTWQDQIAHKCVTCPTGCVACTPDGNQVLQCIHCDPDAYREMVNGTCVCMQGYIQKNPWDKSCVLNTTESKNYNPGTPDPTLSKIILYSSYAILALSAIPCKIIGLQLFGVLQLAYFTLAQIDDPNVVLVPFVNFKDANGPNPDMITSTQKPPSKINAIEYGAVFLNNCGLMLILMVFEGIVGLVLYLVSVFVKPTVLLTSISKRLLKEGFLTLILFNAFNFAFGAAVHFKFADPSQDIYTLNSFLAVLSLLAPVAIMFGLMLTESKQFGEFKDKFKKQRVCQLYFVVTLLYRYFLGYLMAVKSDNQFGTLIVIMVSLLFILYNFVNLPFKTALHNYRANFCHLSQLGILVVANYYESMKSTTDMSIKSQLYTAAYLQIVMIILTVLISIVNLGFEIYYFVRYLIKIRNPKIDSQVARLNKEIEANDTQPNGKKNKGQPVQQESLVNFENMMSNQQNTLQTQDLE